MKRTSIEEIIIDQENRLIIHPQIEQDENFEFIYRDASGVTWLKDIRCLGAREPEKLTHFDLFKQIYAAVRNEYGEMLVVTSETKWLNVPAELESGILKWLQCQ